LQTSVSHISKAPSQSMEYNFIFALLLFLQFCLQTSYSLSGKVFFHLPVNSQPAQLVLISGCTGTGKSTFGMSIALNQGILRCISTDSVRQVLRTFKNEPALHRSSYSGTGDPIIQWRECCDVLQDSVFSLVKDAIQRGVSIVVEGVHIVPSQELLDFWRSQGGIAVGVLLTIPDENAHRSLLSQRGDMTGKPQAAEQQIMAFHRIRTIQTEMIRLAQQAQWVQIEQKVEADPTELVQQLLS
jgi:2-phosphoglycerate kinase